jgi:hypothetical protein
MARFFNAISLFVDDQTASFLFSQNCATFWIGGHKLHDGVLKTHEQWTIVSLIYAQCLDWYAQDIPRAVTMGTN